MFFHIQPNYTAVAKTCNLWRNTNDIDDRFESVHSVIDIYAENKGSYTQIAGPGMLLSNKYEFFCKKKILYKK